MFANGPGDLGSIPGRVIPKTQKMVLDASLLNTQHYKVRIKGKVEQSREGVAPSPTLWCSSYRKGSLRVTLDYGRQLYFLFLTWEPTWLKPSNASCSFQSISNTTAVDHTDWITVSHIQSKGCVYYFLNLDKVFFINLFLSIWIKIPKKILNEFSWELQV